MISLICGILKNGTNKRIYKTEIESQMEKTNRVITKRKWGEDTLSDSGCHTHTSIYKIDNQ